MKLDVDIAIPAKYRAELDLEKCREVFPYGTVNFNVQDGGGVFDSGIVLEKMGDKNGDMVVAIACVHMGY